MNWFTGSEKVEPAAETSVADFERTIEKGLSTSLQDRLHTLKRGIEQNQYILLPEDNNLLSRLLEEAEAEGFSDIGMLQSYITTGNGISSKEVGPETDPENTNITTLDALRDLVERHDVVASLFAKLERKEIDTDAFVDRFDMGSYEVDETLPDLVAQLLTERQA